MGTVVGTAGPALNMPDPERLETVRVEYERDGAAVIRNVIPPEWIARLREGTERLMAESPVEADMNRPGEGRFFGDLFAYLRTAEYQDFIMESGIGRLAGEIMRASKVRFFYDQPLVKEPGTPKPTPWHQDSAYWPCTGRQVMSVWVPLDPATPASGVVTYVRGSHLWNAYYPPENWSEKPDAPSFEAEPGDRDISERTGDGAVNEQLRTLADIRDHPEKYDMLQCNVEPGDILIHQMDTIHGAPGNLTQDQRRRAIAFRFFGDDARWDDTRPHFMRLLHKQAPEFPYPDHQTGDPITAPIFPVLWSNGSA